MKLLIGEVIVVLLLLAGVLVRPGWALDMQDTLSFEVPGTSTPFAGWWGGPNSTLSPDSINVHAGKVAARIKREPESEETFSALLRSVPVHFDVDSIVLRVWLRAKTAKSVVNLFIRQDYSGGALFGATGPPIDFAAHPGWGEFELKQAIDPATTRIVLGVLLTGQGEIDVDDVSILADDHPLVEVRQRRPPQRVADTTLARLRFDQLTQVQCEHLALLCRVWGFLKYYHRDVTAGLYNWDDEVLKVTPAMLEARTSSQAQTVLDSWLATVPVRESCEVCPKSPADFAFAPPIEWIHNRKLLGEALCRRLERVLVSRELRTRQHYVSLLPGVDRPVFDREEPYRERGAPELGLRLLSLFRIWNAVQYWYPYRDLIAEHWEGALASNIRRFVEAKDQRAYRLALIELLGTMQDTHARLVSASNEMPLHGPARIPIFLRHVHSAFVVYGYADSIRGPATGLRVGDVIVALDGVSVDHIVSQSARYYSASNRPALMQEVAMNLARGPTGPCKVRGTRGGKEFELRCIRDSSATLDDLGGTAHDLPGPVFRLLTPDAAYIRVTGAEADSCTEYIRRAAGTKCLIIDVRGYPPQTLNWALGGHLVIENTRFSVGAVCDPGTPGLMRWSETRPIRPVAPHYDGKVIVLVDECTWSAGEFLAMALSATPRAMVVGSQTAGSDGSTTTIPLPGGETAVMTGNGVFYANRMPAERIGIRLDVEARPTIAGVRAGRDEVLEHALRVVLGRSVTIQR